LLIGKLLKEPFRRANASQTNNFVSSEAYYDISFRTATAGIIKPIEMDFLAGTSVGSALLVEAVGIGPGTLLASPGEILEYTVTNEVNVPANTRIRIQISNINNPPTGIVHFLIAIGWMRQNKNRYYKMTKKVRTNTIVREPN
jgi:hypothetical protein